MTARELLRLAILGVVTLCSCSGKGDSTANAEGFAQAYAEAWCARAASCCSPDDYQTVVGGSQATCVQDRRSKLDAGVQLVHYGIMHYDPSMGAACVSKVESAPCSAVFVSTHDDADPCSKFLTGAGPIGGLCDGDYFCASGDCESQRCVEPPCTATSCPAGQYCVVNTGCAALVAQGSACTNYGMCGSQATCVNGICAPLLDDGLACITNSECSSGTCGLVPGSTAKTCRQPYCLGEL